MISPIHQPSPRDFAIALLPIQVGSANWRPVLSGGDRCVNLARARASLHTGSHSWAVAPSELGRRAPAQPVGDVVTLSRERPQAGQNHSKVSRSLKTTAGTASGKVAKRAISFHSTEREE
jgi:hypothetical protein